MHQRDVIHVAGRSILLFVHLIWHHLNDATNLSLRVDTPGNIYLKTLKLDTNFFVTLLDVLIR